MKGCTLNKEKHWVRELEPGMSVSSTFLATDCTVRTDSRGASYLSLKLGDRTGSVDARMWRLPGELAGGLSGPEYVRVEGNAHEYRGMLQVKVERMQTLAKADVEEEDYVPATEKDRELLAAEIELAGAEMENEHLAGLFDYMVSDGEFWEAFCQAPAAKTMHHARIGGLLEHAVHCLRIARSLSDIYPVDRDLLVFGVIFHDIGKLEELSWGRGGFSYTTPGRLLGHVVLGDRMVASYISRLPDFPEGLAMQVSHIMLSHHGEVQYGSPEQPKTLEALLVHFIDNLDARTAMFLETMSNVSPDGWSHHDNPLGRALYLPADSEGDE